MTDEERQRFARRLRERDAEIERLQAGMREYACTATDHPCGCYDQFLSERAEIERLTTIAENAEALRRNLEDVSLAPIVREQGFEIERLRATLESLTKDPPSTLAREPDTDDEVIIKMRAIARAALEPKP